MVPIAVRTSLSFVEPVVSSALSSGIGGKAVSLSLSIVPAGLELSASTAIFWTLVCRSNSSCTLAILPPQCFLLLCFVSLFYFFLSISFSFFKISHRGRIINHPNVFNQRISREIFSIIGIKRIGFSCNSSIDLHNMANSAFTPARSRD